MFNNIIYFIIVLLIFNISYVQKAGEGSPVFDLALFILFWMVFAGYCRLGFQRLLYRHERDPETYLTNTYHRLVLRLSILAILLFSLNVYMLHLKYWLQMIPGMSYFSALQGIVAMALFLFYLSTIWYFSHPAYNLIFQAGIRRRSFIISNVKFNVPILFPWVILTLAYDLLAFTPWAGPEGFLSQPEGQLVFFAVFLGVLMVFLPAIIQSWWGCRPFKPSDRLEELKEFLRTMGFSYRALLKWPIFEGRMMTAGIMGIIPRYRYILVTDSLMEALTVHELKAVMAHEVGHSRYRHLIYYIFFFLGFILLSYGLFDIFFNFLISQPYFMHILEGGEGGQQASIFYLALSIPVLLTMLIYFRYVMGFFMRNFERQADLYSARVMGGPEPVISALEKIAFLSGRSRNVPSWHHFSIKQRVDCLLKTLKSPEVIRRHNRFIAVSLIVFFTALAGVGYLLNFSPLKQALNERLIKNTIRQQLNKDPRNILLLQSLAMVYQQMEKYRDAIQTYERLLSYDSSQPVALNNLAWLLVTVPDKSLRDPPRALDLAKKAVALERSPVFLDTLAEAYYVNGFAQQAVEIIKEAISLEKGDDAYYKGQLRKFMGGSKGS